MADFHHSEITCRKVSPPKRLRNQDMLVHWAPSLAWSVARRRRGEPISTAFVEKCGQPDRGQAHEQEQQMRWDGTTVQPFLDVLIAVLNEMLEDAFPHHYPGLRSPTDDQALSAAA